MKLIFLELVDLIYIILGAPAMFIRQDKCLRLGDVGGLLLLGFLLIPLPFIMCCHDSEK